MGCLLWTKLENFYFLTAGNRETLRLLSIKFTLMEEFIAGK